jgi:hypothetical protein
LSTDESPISLLGRSVIVSGKAYFGSTGRHRYVLAERIAPAAAGDLEVWSELPAPLFVQPALGRSRRAQTSETGINAIFGKWPGDETDEEFFRMIEEIS